jgi:hypothetical protein
MDNDEFIKKLLTEDINSIKYINDKKKTPEFCEIAFYKDHRNFEEIPSRDPNLVKYATELSKNSVEDYLDDTYFFYNRLDTIIKKLPDDLMTFEILENCINTGSTLHKNNIVRY